MKKIIAMVIIFAIIVGVVPTVSVSANPTGSYSGGGGEVKT